jgi:SAM-dependent methyltransferase
VVDAIARAFDGNRDRFIYAAGVLMPDAKTIATYDTKAADYALIVASDTPDASLQTFIQSIPKDGRVLDLGCGPGTAAAHMRDAGLQPDLIDASAGMIALAREKYGLAAQLGTFDDIAGDCIYDGIWANFSLLHAPRNDLPRHLAALAKALKQGGLLHIGMKTGSGEKRDAIDRLYTFLTVKELEKLLTDAGFEVTNKREGQDAGLAGTIDPFVIMLARKND